MSDPTQDGKNEAVKKIAAYNLQKEDSSVDVDVLINNPVILIYNHFVDTAEKNIDRRMAANKFYLTATGAVLGALSLVLTKQITFDATSGKIVVGLILFAALCVQAFWLANVMTSRRLSASKYDVIHEIEAAFLPVKPFTREWEIHTAKKRDKPRFTSLEAFTPIGIGILSITGLILLVLDLLPLPF